MIGVRGRCSSARPVTAPSGEGCSLPLQLEILERAERIRAGGGARGASADEDLPRLGDLLEPSGDVHGVAGHDEVGARLVAARHDLAGVDPDPDRQPLAERRVLAHGVPQLQRGVDRPPRVVVVGDRQPEDRHRGVADELLERAGVPLHDPAREIVEAREQASQVLRVERLAERGRADDIGEQDGDEASFVRHDRRATRRAGST